MKKIMYLIIFTLFMVCVYKKEVKAALSGTGTSSNPYIVTSGSELKTALSKGTSSWKYIAVTDTAAVTETITVETGKFRIYSKGGNWTIRRSQSMSATVNSSSKPLRCIKLDGDAKVELGYGATSNKLTINGSKNYFTDSRQCNEWFYVGSKAELRICANCLFTNAKNTMKTDEAAPIRVYGALEVYGEISNCEGNNGGAIKCIGGNVDIFSGAKIHGCKSGTEGGAVYGRDFSIITMNAGSVYSNQAVEEGGGFFSTEAYLFLYGGSIYSNTAGKTGGGVFSGNANNLYFGSNGSGPSVTNNYAKSSGGGVRCNGGSDEPGGFSDFAGGTISNNRTDVSGGGISIGKPSSSRDSKIQMMNMTISNNTASNYGGGICFSEGVKGKNSDVVEINSTVINGNKSSGCGGGIHLNTKLKSNNNVIKNNNCDSGGGIYITSAGTLKMESGQIENNSGQKGSGVYQSGIIELSNNGYVDSSNTVYLPKNRHIDITGKLTKSSGLASYIDSEVKTKGTVLVDVTYSGGTGESELYYSGSSNAESEGNSVTKKFSEKNGCLLRSSENNTQFSTARYIIISEKYKVKYNGNSLDPVANLPAEEIAFWKEKHTISNNIVSRIGFVLNINKHWNLSADGTGKVYKPGLETIIESETTLYAIWDEIKITSLTMTTYGRYYVVGQNISLTNKELLKKVKVENDLNIDITYEVKVTKIKTISGKTIATGDDIKTEDYIDTGKSEHYTLYLSSSNSSGTVTCTGTMMVHIIEDYYSKTEVRFISKEFINTLDPRSKWVRYKNGTLSNALNNENDPVYTVELDKTELEDIKNRIKSNEHKIDHGINSYVSTKVIKK